MSGTDAVLLLDCAAASAPGTAVERATEQPWKIPRKILNMVKIRLRRMGSRHRPFYRVVVSDSRKVPTSAVIEEVGHYDPCKDPAVIRAEVGPHRPLGGARSAAHGHGFAAWCGGRAAANAAGS